MGIIHIAVLSLLIVATIDWLCSTYSKSDFFVGVEFVYYKNSVDSEELVYQIKDLVNKVKDHANLFVISSLEILFNQTALNEARDYVVNCGLHLFFCR